MVKGLLFVFLVNFEILFRKLLKYILIKLLQSSWSSQGSVSFAALGPKAVQRPKPVKASNIASIETAIETAGSGADDKVCINFAKFVNNLCTSSYTITK